MWIGAPDGIDVNVRVFAGSSPETPTDLDFAAHYDAAILEVALEVRRHIVRERLLVLWSRLAAADPVPQKLYLWDLALKRCLQASKRFNDYVQELGFAVHKPNTTVPQKMNQLARRGWGPSVSKREGLCIDSVDKK